MIQFTSFFGFHDYQNNQSVLSYFLAPLFWGTKKSVVSYSIIKVELETLQSIDWLTKDCPFMMTQWKHPVLKADINEEEEKITVHWNDSKSPPLHWN